MALTFELPAAWLLAVPVGLALWRWRSRGPLTNVARALAALCLIAALAGPRVALGPPGRDLVLVIDRSESMPAETSALAEELVRLAAEERRRGDRVSVVAFGRAPAVELAPTEAALPATWNAPVDPGASDLASALDLALRLVPAARPARLLVLSDGEATGADPVAAARRARARGIPIHVRAAQRPIGADLVAARIELPQELPRGTPFEFAAWVFAERERSAAWRLTRDGEEIAAGTSHFPRGWSAVRLGDRPPESGLARYRFELLDVGDPFPENDHALGVLRVTGPSRALVFNELGGTSALVTALLAAGFEVDARAPEAASSDPLAYEGFDLVVLENVSAPRIGHGAARTLARQVMERGQGLLMTGGQASFARGGWWQSHLDPALPVDLDPRDQDARQPIAMGLALDRSGSMNARIGGFTKMELANMGAERAIDLLQPGDFVTLFAVDTSAHVVIPLTEVVQSGELGRIARGIESRGGGIYTFNAMEALIRELARAGERPKHLVIFADAADAEQPEGCVPLARQVVAAGGTVTVIALGAPTDIDGPFLIELGRAGEGGAHFTADARDLPELFAQETLAITRTGFVEEATGGRALADWWTLAPDLAPEDFPVLAGYNLSRPRPGARVALATTDGRDAPLIAVAERGAGRAAVYAGQVGGQFGANLVEWEGFSPLFGALARHLVELRGPADVHGTLAVEGTRLRVAVDLGPSAAHGLAGEPSARVRGPWGAAEVPLERVAFDRLEGFLDLPAPGVVVGNLIWSGPDGTRADPDLGAAVLSHSPEWTRDPDTERGRRLLARLAEETGGGIFEESVELYAGPRTALGERSLVPLLAMLALLVALTEIALRRLPLGARLEAAAERLLQRARRASAVAPEEDAESAREIRSAVSPPKPAGPAAPAATSAPVAPPAASGDTLDALQQARNKARRRTHRDGRP